MKKTIIVVSVLFYVCLPCFNQVTAQDHPPNYTPYFPNYPPLTPEEMMAFARQGAEYLENGGDIEAFNKNPGKFTKGVFLDYRYLVVVDCKTGTMLATSFLSEVINQEGLVFKIKDGWDRAYGAEVCSAVLKKSNGTWLVAYVKKPGEHVFDLIYKYFIRVKNSDMAVGMYSRNLRIESHLEQRAREEEAILNSLVK
ncbi:MAG: hypothetical protein GY801_40085 [bacterium]|nr:hypothetical protein [bacterium]